MSTFRRAYHLRELSRVLGISNREMSALIATGEGPPFVPFAGMKMIVTDLAIEWMKTRTEPGAIEWVQQVQQQQQEEERQEALSHIPNRNVYVVAPHLHGPVKIGAGHYPRIRRTVLSNALERELNLYFVAKIYGQSNAGRVERHTHQILDAFRDWSGAYTPLTSEWFKVDVQTAISTIRKIIAEFEFEYEFEVKGVS